MRKFGRTLCRTAPAASVLSAGLALPGRSAAAADRRMVRQDNFDDAGYLARCPDLAQYCTPDQEAAIWDFYRNTGGAERLGRGHPPAETHHRDKL